MRVVPHGLPDDPFHSYRDRLLAHILKIKKYLTFEVKPPFFCGPQPTLRYGRRAHGLEPWTPCPDSYRGSQVPGYLFFNFTIISGNRFKFCI